MLVLVRKLDYLEAIMEYRLSLHCNQEKLSNLFILDDVQRIRTVGERPDLCVIWQLVGFRCDTLYSIVFTIELNQNS